MMQDTAQELAEHNDPQDESRPSLRDEVLRVLEFDKIIRLLAQLTVTAPGRECILALQPLAERDEVESSLQAVEEARTLLEEKGSPPLGGSHDLTTALERVRAPGAWLLPPALLQIADSIEAAQRCRDYFGTALLAPQLTQRVEALQPLVELGQRLRRSVGADGEIRDEASWQLADLRLQSKQLRQRIRAALEGLLQRQDLQGAFQDQVVTERNGRYVVPVKADHRGQVKGFIHDESASGQTLYVEPEQVLERNNQLQSLLREQQREIQRILLALGEDVRGQRDRLQVNQRILADLDRFAAMARFARLTQAVAPQITGQRQLELKQVRHPLLLLNTDATPRKSDAVAIDLRLGKKHDTLIISGPNTGGKTVALKTVGLLFLMVSAGIPIPCHPHSRVYLFSKIFADIGDEQSIEGDLSTFSGHLLRIRRILKYADGQSLVLLDEAGTGTDPAEGGALALAVLDQLRSRGARCVVTTHLNMIKGYAFLHERVENAAVEFDPQTLAPTYRLHYGMPGASSALTIAERMGLPKKVLRQAEAYLGQEERDGLAVVERLNALSSELLQQREEAQALRAQAAADQEKRRKLLHAFEAQRKELLDKARKQAEQLLSETRHKMRALLKQARELQPQQIGREQAELMSQLRAEGDQITEALRPLQPARRSAAPTQVEVGELVRVVALGTEAEVQRISGDQIDLGVSGKRMRLPLAALESFSPRRFATAAARTRVPALARLEHDDFRPELNLVGCRVEEALPRVEQLIDDALLHDWHQLSVTHGRGTGALRQAIHELLATHRAVTAFHFADHTQGGNAVTVIELGERSR